MLNIISLSLMEKIWILLYRHSGHLTSENDRTYPFLLMFSGKFGANFEVSSNGHGFMNCKQGLEFVILHDVT